MSRLYPSEHDALHAKQMGFARKFEDEQRRVLTTHFKVNPLNVTISDDQTDLYYGTDFQVKTFNFDTLEDQTVNVAARVRAYGYLRRYPNEFTARLTAGGNQGINELEKIIRARFRFMLYGFCDPKEQHLVKWSLLDMRVVKRAAEANWKDVEMLDAVYADNCEFQPFKLTAFPQDMYGKLVIASWTKDQVVK